MIHHSNHQRCDWSLLSRCIFSIIFIFAIIAIITIIIITTAIKCCLTREEVEQKENIAALAIGQAKVRFFYCGDVGDGDDSDDDDDDNDDIYYDKVSVCL